MATDLQKKWEERIEAAKKKRDEWKNEFDVQRGIDYFEGKSNPGFPESEWININKIYSHLQAQLPKLYSVDPYFYVKVKKSHTVLPQQIIEFERRGKIRGAMLNYLKGEVGLKHHARLAIQDAHFAYGVMKIRRASDQKEHPNAGEPIVDEEGVELKNEDGSTMVYPDTIPVHERYEVERVHPDDFLADEHAGPLPNSWTWLATRIQMSKSEALDDPRFKRSAVRKVKGKKREEDNRNRPSYTSSMLQKIRSDGTDDEDIINIWEIYDLKKKEWLMIAEDGEEPLVKPRNVPPGTEDHCFSILRFTLRDKSFYPIPPVYNAIGPQKELSLSRSRLMVHRKRFNRKYEVVTSKLEDPDIEIEKLEAGEDGTIIRAMANGSVYPINDAPLDPTGLQELRLLDNDIVEALGTPDIARGIASADSATEAGLLDARLGIREGDRMSMVVDFILDVAKKLDQLVQVHIDGDEAVKIVGPEGETWEIVRQTDYEDIEGEFDYSVNVGASQPRLPDVERAQLTAFISQVVIPFPAILTNKLLMKKFAELFHIEDDALVESLVLLGQQVVSGQVPGPNQQGGGPSDNPVAAIMGAAGGALGGNNSGGGVNA